MTKQKSMIPVYLAAVAYACITGFSYVFTKMALAHSAPIPVLAHRFLFSMATLLILLFAQKKWSYFSVSAFRNIAPLALFYPLLFFGTQTFGLQYATSAEGGILLAIAPVFTLLLSHFFLKEKATILQALSVVLSVGGVVYIFYGTSKQAQGAQNSSLLGIVLLLVTTLCFSIYSVLTRRYTTRYKNLELLTVMITIGFVGFHLLGLFSGSFSSLDDYIKPFRSGKYTVAVLYLGVLSTLGTSMLTNFILSRLEASKMSVFSNLGTLISIVAGAVVLDERIYYFHILGAVCIILGVVGANFGKRRARDGTEESSV